VSPRGHRGLHPWCETGVHSTGGCPLFSRLTPEGAPWGAKSGHSARGALSLKLAALGRAEDRGALEALCAAKPSGRQATMDGYTKQFGTAMMYVD